MENRSRLFCFLSFHLFALFSFGQNWSMKQANLMTPFAATIDTSNVLGEYPRPQMVRTNWMNLNGIWQFQPGTSLSQPLPTGNLTGKILVPFPVESAISGVMRHYDKLWYRRTFTVPIAWSGQRILLHFGAVDYRSEVFINGQSLGIHSGGYDPFTFDITSKLTGSGPQVLIVRVYDPTSAGGQPRGKQALNPASIMYTCTSGIWQTVWLEPVSQTSISDIKLIPDVDLSVLNVTVNTNGVASNQTVTVRVKDGDNIVTTFNGNVNTNLVIPIPNPKLWSPESPFLYDLDITLNSEKVIIDHLTSYFGMRKISISYVDGYQKMMLNNHFVFEIGPLDQGFWPDGIYTAPTDSALRFDIVKMKEFGFNMVRKHLKVEPARWYYWADKLGLMVWQDMPSANSYSEVTTDVDEVAYRNELIRLVQNHWNSPCIIMWVLFNESQGQQNTMNLVSEVMLMDPSRLVNQASGGTHFGVGHVLDIHSYPSPSCPTSSDQALACGEYGGIGYSINNHIWDGFGYVMVYSAEELATMYDQFMNDLLQFKTNSGLSAAVYTEITDVEIELNGLMTYDRVIDKTDPKRIFESNQRAINKSLYLTDVLPTANIVPQAWSYTFNQPTGNWESSFYDDADWLSGESGFGTSFTPGTFVNTLWDTNDIWMRRLFYLGGLTPETRDSLAFYLHHDEACEIYLNGVPATSLTGYSTSYVLSPISTDAKNALVTNAYNTIAIHCNQSTGGQYMDAGISIFSYDKKPLALKTISFNECTIFPNPVVDKLQLFGLDGSKISVHIYNTLGILMLQNNNCNYSINVSDFPEGLYILQLSNGKKSYNLQFFKKK